MRTVFLGKFVGLDWETIIYDAEALQLLADADPGRLHVVLDALHGEDDADRDPFLQTSMVENTSLRSVLLHIEKPSPYVIFAIRGAGKSSMRIDTERYLKQGDSNRYFLLWPEPGRIEPFRPPPSMS